MARSVTRHTLRVCTRGPASFNGVRHWPGFWGRHVPAASGHVATVVRSPLASDCAGAGAGGQAAASESPGPRLVCGVRNRRAVATARPRDPRPAQEWAGATWATGSVAGARLGQTSRAMTVPRPRVRSAMIIRCCLSFPSYEASTGISEHVPLKSKSEYRRKYLGRSRRLCSMFSS